ncbi:MAG: 2-(3-amino-3-carboxypropyl)histidine synthase [DPANN group archaeon]|nr:2-(3-amino-3-carboxypropyl)histidine synthase [DPANN group archaeon]
MKVLHLEARYTKKIALPAAAIRKLPEKVALFMSVQFLDSLQDIKAALEKRGKKVLLFQTRHTRYLGQLYGCNNEKYEGDYDAFLYVGDGEFHPKALALANRKPIFIYNPITKKSGQWKQQYFLEEQKRTRAALLRFHSSERIGILVTTKSGQNKIRLGKLLEKRHPEKTFFYLVFDSLEFGRLEDFPFIQCLVNTACERIAFEDRKRFFRPVINAEDILWPERLQ